MATMCRSRDEMGTCGRGWGESNWWKKAIHIVEKLRCCRKSLVCKINLIDFICNVYKLICTHTASHPGLQWKMVQLKFDRRSERERSLIDHIMNYNCPSFVVRCSSFAELAQNDYECAHTHWIWSMRTAVRLYSLGMCVRCNARESGMHTGKIDTNYGNIYDTNKQQVDMTLMLDAFGAILIRKSRDTF